MVKPVHRRHKDGGRFARRLFVAVFLAALAWAAGLFRFVDAIPTEVADLTSRTDAIVVLTGGSGRLSEGLDLLTGDRAEKLFVSGVYRGVDVAKLLELSQRSPEELQCCVEIGHSADNTAGNAAETAEWVRQQGYGSLRIVTASYHMPRSLLEFKYNLPEARLIPHPVFPEHVMQERWWAWPGTSILIVGEYNKFLLAWTRHLGSRLLSQSNDAPNT